MRDQLPAPVKVAFADLARVWRGSGPRRSRRANTGCRGQVTSWNASLRDSDPRHGARRCMRLIDEPAPLALVVVAWRAAFQACQIIHHTPPRRTRCTALPDPRPDWLEFTGPVSPGVTGDRTLGPRTVQLMPRPG
jgi:hypothetical protein